MTESEQREMLEMAARAADMGYFMYSGNGACTVGLHLGLTPWSPLTDDGDAFRLAVKLRLVVHVWDDGETASAAKTLPHGEDLSPLDNAWHSADAHAAGGIGAATRLAITRAAAEIGRGMP